VVIRFFPTASSCPRPRDCLAPHWSCFTFQVRRCPVCSSAFSSKVVWHTSCLVVLPETSQHDKPSFPCRTVCSSVLPVLAMSHWTASIFAYCGKAIAKVKLVVTLGLRNFSFSLPFSAAPVHPSRYQSSFETNSEGFLDCKACSSA
jgi:hypothetical protein